MTEKTCIVWNRRGRVTTLTELSGMGMDAKRTELVFPPGFTNDVDRAALERWGKGDARMKIRRVPLTSVFIIE